MVGPESPFHAANVPPDQYIIPEVILEKPGKLDHKGFDQKTVPFSGKLGVLGYKILDDWRKAKHLTTFEWQEEQFKNAGTTSPHKKPEKPITSKLTLNNFERNGQVYYK